MAWNDNVCEADFGGSAELALDRTNLADDMKWETFTAYTSIGRNLPPNDCKIEYVVKGKSIVTVTVVCLDEPLADMDVTQQLTEYELHRLYDLAAHDYEQKCKPRRT